MNFFDELVPVICSSILGQTRPTTLYVSGIMMMKLFGAAKQLIEKKVSHFEMHFRVGELLQQSMLDKKCIQLFKLGLLVWIYLVVTDIDY